jgi:hypothetical protein
MTLKFKMQKKTFNLLCKKYKEKSNSKKKKTFSAKTKKQNKIQKKIKKKTLPSWKI